MDLITVAVLIGVAFALSFLVESLTEYLFGTPLDHISRLQPYKWALMYIALGVGVGLALYWKIDLVAVIAYVIGSLAGAPAALTWSSSTVGMVLSGLAIGHGSNYLHDWLTKALQKPVIPTPGP